MMFTEKLARAIRRNDSLLCIGLDSELSKIPDFLKEDEDPLLEFNRIVVSQTKDLVCSYKLNLAFYEAEGAEGIKTLMETIKAIPKHIPVIIDGKRGDIGNTARLYAKAVFETLGGDAATVNPYLGYDSIEPFLRYSDKYVFVICKTSNPSSSEFQDIEVRGKRLYQIVAEKIREWGKNCGAVVGATYPEMIREVRKIVGDGRILLIPGIGKQGGDLESSIRYGCTSGENIIINVSRSIIYAEGEFPESVRGAAERYREEINRVRCSLEGKFYQGHR